mmetsp:Transcript_2573/g.7594  ORF Transcript_2573/g.7594 Transcript_2573/m.7594 type:complete len:126 (-) Transcript_2573:208-585(-)|eukprot:CAMPEP_0118885328 /NCGR_PEP_ID=MMETSP1163-20130328/23849_1 /TAXON_ID=124430 /ORGANISM="Phaeomonas parva, Strain CCMP2877" /LENGTH=125 /DNA_ID=CAMNT_0006823323 /DNA_START=87 /DNA_END=464 /DNA_ORIENTATION=+
MAWRNNLRRVANSVRFCYSAEHPSGQPLMDFVKHNYAVVKMMNPQMRFPNRLPAEGHDMEPYVIFHTDAGDTKVDVAGLSEQEITMKIKATVESLPALDYIDDDVPPAIIDGIEQQSFRPWGGSI